MKELFCSYEQSLALKELGFNEPCLACWNFYTNEFYYNSYPTNFFSDDVVQLPTKSQVFKWFREKHNLEYQIIKSANGNYSVIIHKNTQEYLDKIATLPHGCLEELVDLYSYEEAENSCIDKLIHITILKFYE